MQRTALADRMIQIPGYQILRRMNQGPAASTYLATREGGPRRLLLKIFTRPAVRQTDFAARFQYDCKTLSRIRHPNIARIYDGGVSGGLCYLAMEYATGIERIDEWAVETPLHQLLQQLVDLARALHFAHGEGLVHGSLEAAKVLVQGDKRVLLTGFEEQLLPSHPMIDDPHYLAPECCRGEEPSAASDIYSLGMLLYCLLAQRPPESADFAAGERLKSVVDGVPSLPGHLRVMQPLINKCLTPEPMRRFKHAGMVADAIGEVTDEDLEAIQIATPHYLARLMSVKREDDEALLSLEEDEAVAVPVELAEEDAGENKEADAGPSRRRRTWRLVLLASIVLAAGTAIQFRDRLPSSADLLIWMQIQLQAASDYLSQLNQGAEELQPTLTPAPPPAGWAVEAEPMDEAPVHEEGTTDLLMSLPEEAELLVEPLSPELSTASEPLPEPQPQLVEDFIAEGDRLLAEDALTLPDGANALAAYRQALVLEPGNARAWAGLQNIVRRYIQLAQAGMDGGEWRRAAEFVRRGLSVDPNNRELLSLQSRLTAQEAPPDADEVEALSAMARIQMVRENYVTPAGDSAYDHYSRLLLLEPNNPEARSALARIERELASEIELQVNRNRFSQAQALLVRAQDAFPASQRFHRLTLALEAAMQSEQDRRVSVEEGN